MERGVMLVFSNPVNPSGEAAFNEWYTQVHLRDVLKVPGFVAAQRYRLSDTQMGDPKLEGRRYLAIYEIEGSDLGAVRAALIAAVQQGMQISETLDMPGVSTAFFEPLCERLTA